jgi:hypothetical protein
MTASQLRMENLEGFRFLDLPKDIRLEIYDHFPIEIRHHAIQSPSFSTVSRCTITTKRIPCMELLTTCRETYHEVSALLRPRLDGEPLRIFINWKHMCLCAIDCILSSTMYLDMVGDTRLLSKNYHSNDDGYRQTPDMREVFLLHQAISISPELKVELLVELDDDFVRRDSARLRMKVIFEIFYKWLKSRNEVGHLEFGGPIHITIRPKAVTEGANSVLNEARPFEHLDFPKECWLGKTLTCQVGECMTESEWQRNWEEGKHFGRMKRA